MSGPRLAAEVLMWRNRRSRIKAGETMIGLLLAIGLIAMLIAGRQSLAMFVQWLRSNGTVCAGLGAFFSAIAIAQRRNLMRNQFPRSWLSTLPVRPTAARWEGFLMVILPAIIVVAALCLLAALVSLTLWFTTSPNIAAIAAVWAYLAGGVACGTVLSFLVPRPRPVDLPPGSRYVPKAKTYRAAIIRSSLSGLGHWPVRQMFAWAQPKVVSRALIPALVMMPLGTKADDAMIAIALFGVMFAMLLLIGAVFSVSRSAHRWLAPLPVRRAAVLRAFLLPACGAIVVAGVFAALLLLIFNVPYRVAAMAGAAGALAGCAMIAVVLIWNTRPRRAP